MDSKTHIDEKPLKLGKGELQLKMVAVKQESVDDTEESYLRLASLDQEKSESEMDFEILNEIKTEFDTESTQSESSFRSKIAFEDDVILNIVDEEKSNKTQEEISRNLKIEKHEKFEVTIKIESLNEDILEDNASNVYDLLVELKENYQGNENNVKVEEVLNLPIHYDILVAPNEVRCELCGRKFTNRLNLLKHNIEHIKLDTKLPISMKSELNQSSKIVQKPYKCDKCGKLFSKYRRWHEHSVQVHRTGVYICEYCDKKFNCIKYVKQHIRKVHRNNNVVPCDKCEAVFKHSENLKLHIKNCHVNEVHECELCGVVFKCKPYLRSHMKRVHFDYGTTFPCDCGKTFRTPKALYAHKRNKKLYVRKKN